MDPKEEARLLRLYDEVETDTGSEDDEEGFESISDEDPYAGSDDRDLDYLPTNDSSNDSSDDSNCNNSTLPTVENQTVADAEGSSSDENDEWEETYNDIPDFNLIMLLQEYNYILTMILHL